MNFQLEKPTFITITNANPRRELHGDGAAGDAGADSDANAHADSDGEGEAS